MELSIGQTFTNKDTQLCPILIFSQSCFGQCECDMSLDVMPSGAVSFIGDKFFIYILFLPAFYLLLKSAYKQLLYVLINVGQTIN